MKVIDPHVHFWDVDAVPYPWLDEPTLAYSGDNRLLPKRYTIRDLKSEAGPIEVFRTIDIEANSGDPLTEARWLQSQANDRSNEGHPHGIVAQVDLSSAEAPKRLDELSSIANLRGVRQIVNRHPERRFNYAARDYLSDPVWRSNLRILARHRWSFDLQLYPSQASTALEVISANLAIPFIVNHGGMFVDRHLQGYREWRAALRTLATQPHVQLKISGLAMFDHHWTVESFRPLVLEAIDAFGVERCMFASNFPIDRLHGDYSALWYAYRKIVEDLSVDERNSLFIQNAAKVYRLSASDDIS